MRNRYKKMSIIIIITCFILPLTGCVDPIDDPVLPDRGFYMGLLANPAKNQDFSESYALASEHAEFVPIWSSGTGADGFWSAVGHG